MRDLILVGSGWHSPLFRAEANSLVGSLETLHPRMVFATVDESSMDLLTKSSLVESALHSSCRLWAASGISSMELAEKIGDWADKFLPNGKFAVRARKFGSGIEGLSRRDVEIESGAIISSSSKTVDLLDPEFEVVVIMAGIADSPSHPDPFFQKDELIVWGIKENIISGPYNSISPTERPFFKPVTLDPRLARLMVTLSYNSGHRPKAIIDPFCGTGGIAIEAQKIGLEVLASDLDKEMVEGTRRNLAWVEGGGNSTVCQHSADSIYEKWGQIPGCAFVFDPPYGRNARASEDSFEIIMGALNSASQMIASSVCMMLPTSPEFLDGNSSSDLEVVGREWGEVSAAFLSNGWAVSSRHIVRVHKSLSRMLLVCNPSD